MDTPILDAGHHPLPEQEGTTRERVLVMVLIGATVLAFVLCCLLFRPFVPVLAWALALAIIARPLHDALAARLSSPNLAAALAVLLVALLIMLPSLFVLQSLIREATLNAPKVQVDQQGEQLLANAEQTPGIGPVATWLRENVDIRAALREIAAFLTRNASQAVTTTIWILVEFLFVLFTLFFFFRDRGKALAGVRSLLPLSNKEASEVFQKIEDTIYATVYGSLIVALIQGTMGGLMFWWLGLPAPVVWGAIMALLAVVPNLGTFVVWAPTAVYLALNGHTTDALILAAWGGIAIAFIDNLLYPYLVGKRMRLHTLLVFFSMLGGLWLLGASGVVLGPTILAVTLALIDVWRRRTAGGRPAEAAVQNIPQGGSLLQTA